MREIKFRTYNDYVETGYREQWTGLKDINNKEIYEGDIVRYGDNKIAKVVYDAPTFRLDPERYGETLSNQVVQVIGNIYENKDLLDV